MRDKLKHVFWGAFFAFLIGVPVYADTYKLFAGLWGCLAGVIAGGVKEWCDNRFAFGKWDWKDLGFTCLGVGILMLFVLCMHFGKG